MSVKCPEGSVLPGDDMYDFAGIFIHPLFKVQGWGVAEFFFQKCRYVKMPAMPSCTALLCFMSVALLFKISGNHPYGFVQIHGFGYGFESGGAHKAVGMSHMCGKIAVVNRVGVYMRVFAFRHGVGEDVQADGAILRF